MENFKPKTPPPQKKKKQPPSFFMKTKLKYYITSKT
jgi:hypothetical protein